MADERPKKPFGGAYGIWLAENRAELRREVGPGRPVTEVSKLAGSRWKALSQETKALYREKFEQAKAKYAEEMRQQEATSQKKGTKRKAEKHCKKDNVAEKKYSLIEVEVTQMSGDALASLSLLGTCVIRDVKLELERQQGIPHQQAQLVVPGAFNKLEDHKTIADCGVSGGKLPLILVRNSGFLPSKRFDGSLEGYVFKLGDQGLGYYIDS
ncbi:HMGB13 [Symbiodinium natans]|uniref:HMGB13 protein n=1 Tax=Symbiodinium natans TaxID=878477 RepID=A0A812NP73_9DINO|nr:HMGB13 [Symbiodinium natans]